MHMYNSLYVLKYCFFLKKKKTDMAPCNARRLHVTNIPYAGYKFEYMCVLIRLWYAY